VSPPPTTSVPVESPPVEAARWFSEQVQPHESQLRGYLRGAFPRVRDVDDVVQESFLRIWQARAVHPILSTKAFLFRIARNLALDSLRRDQASPIEAVPGLSEVPVIEERAGAAEILNAEEKSRLLGEALADLPERCRIIMLHHKIKGLPQRAVAEQMGLTEKTVANQVGLGVKRCEEFFRRRGIEFF